ncbi:MAG: hypothetical protein U0R69_06855 [Gaiellales bacterium]
MTRPRTALAIVVALLATAVALLVIELANGAREYGTLQSKDACTARAGYPGDGLDATLQRIALNGLYGAACELGTTREQLVLSFVPSVSGAPIQWDHETIERAVESGLIRAIDDAQERGSLPGFAATILRELVKRAPIDWLLDQAGSLQDLIDRAGDLPGAIGDALDELLNLG